jgi:hypothetical protein
MVLLLYLETVYPASMGGYVAYLNMFLFYAYNAAAVKQPHCATLNLTMAERLRHVKIQLWEHTASRLSLEGQMGFAMAEKKKIAAEHAPRYRKATKRRRQSGGGIRDDNPLVALAIPGRISPGRRFHADTPGGRIGVHAGYVDGQGAAATASGSPRYLDRGEIRRNTKRRLAPFGPDLDKVCHKVHTLNMWGVYGTDEYHRTVQVSSK